MERRSKGGSAPKARKSTVGHKVNELLRVYEDLEKTLKGLRAAAGADNSIHNINLKRLVKQLSASKRKLERKISSTLLMERQQWQTRLRKVLPHKPRSRFSRSSDARE